MIGLIKNIIIQNIYSSVERREDVLHDDSVNDSFTVIKGSSGTQQEYINSMGSFENNIPNAHSSYIDQTFLLSSKPSETGAQEPKVVELSSEEQELYSNPKDGITWKTIIKVFINKQKWYIKKIYSIIDSNKNTEYIDKNEIKDNIENYLNESIKKICENLDNFNKTQLYKYYITIPYSYDGSFRLNDIVFTLDNLLEITKMVLFIKIIQLMTQVDTKDNKHQLRQPNHLMYNKNSIVTYTQPIETVIKNIHDLYSINEEEPVELNCNSIEKIDIFYSNILNFINKISEQQNEKLKEEYQVSISANEFPWVKKQINTIEEPEHTTKKTQLKEKSNNTTNNIIKTIPYTFTNSSKKKKNKSIITQSVGTGVVIGGVGGVAAAAGQFAASSNGSASGKSEERLKKPYAPIDSDQKSDGTDSPYAPVKPSQKELDGVGINEPYAPVNSDQKQSDGVNKNEPYAPVDSDQKQSDGVNKNEPYAPVDSDQKQSDGSVIENTPYSQRNTDIEDREEPEKPNQAGSL